MQVTFCVTHHVPVPAQQWPVVKDPGKAPPFSFSGFFETGFLCVVLAVLELAL